LKGVKLMFDAMAFQVAWVTGCSNCKMVWRELTLDSALKIPLPSISGTGKKKKTHTLKAKKKKTHTLKALFDKYFGVETGIEGLKCERNNCHLNKKKKVTGSRRPEIVSLPNTLVVTFNRFEALTSDDGEGGEKGSDGKEGFDDEKGSDDENSKGSDVEEGSDDVEGSDYEKGSDDEEHSDDEEGADDDEVVVVVADKIIVKNNTPIQIPDEIDMANYCSDDELSPSKKYDLYAYIVRALLECYNIHSISMFILHLSSL
jgi:hypothetical protein